MEKVSLSSLVVSCKDYKPESNWYFRKSEGYIYGAVNRSDTPGYDEARIKAFEESDDYVLTPECPWMTDEEAAAVIREWCEENSIPYNDDLERIEEVYRWYYKYDG